MKSEIKTESPQFKPHFFNLRATGFITIPKTTAVTKGIRKLFPFVRPVNIKYNVPVRRKATSIILNLLPIINASVRFLTYHNHTTVTLLRAEDCYLQFYMDFKLLPVEINLIRRIYFHKIPTSYTDRFITYNSCWTESVSRSHWIICRLVWLSRGEQQVQFKARLTAVMQ